MKKVLFITYFFPPTGGAGVQRPTKFVKYLRTFGWEPIVLTVSNPSVPSLDDSFIKDIPIDIQLHKSRTLEPKYEVKNKLKNSANEDVSIFNNLKILLRKFVIPDPQILWIPDALRKASKIIKKNNPDMVFVTAPPFSSLLIGYIIKILYRVPVVLDFRDEWIGFFETSGFSPTQRKRNSFQISINRFLEKKCIQAANGIVTASPGYIDNFKKKYRFFKNKCFSCITNGFDPEDFLFAGHQNDDDIPLDSKYLHFAYAGTVFEVTTLRYFMDAILSLPMEYRNRIKLHIFGRVVEEELKYLEALTHDVIILHGYVDHRTLLQKLRNVDLLIVSLDVTPGSERVIPGKIFEYIALRKFIMALVPDGEAKKIMEGYSNSITINPRDSGNIANAIKNMIDSKNQITADTVDITKYSRVTLTEQLAVFFDDVLRKDGSKVHG